MPIPITTEVRLKQLLNWNGTATKVVDSAGRVTAITRANGAKFAITYDGGDRITSMRPPVGNKVTMAYTYNTKTTRGALVEKALTYDGYGNVISKNTGASQPLINTIHYIVKLLNLILVLLLAGVLHEAGILDRMTKPQHADGKAVNIAYGASNRSVTDELGRVTTQSYRSYGDQTSSHWCQWLPNTTCNVTIARNSVDLPTSIVQAGITRSFAYNANYFLSSETQPETGTTVYGRMQRVIWFLRK